MSVPSVAPILFVPGDSERKIEKSRASNADALVLDLEDWWPGRKDVRAKIDRLIISSAGSARARHGAMGAHQSPRHA